MNSITIFGRLAKDPEIRDFGEDKMVYLNVAQCRRKNQDPTIWWSVSFKKSSIEKLVPYLKKGDAFVITGEMQFPKIYKSSSGEERASLKIVGCSIKFNPFFEKKEESSPIQKEDVVDFLL